MAEGLAAEGLALSYGRSRIVQGLDLCLPQGRFTPILGANGSCREGGGNWRSA
jgi:ABC-type cobalamin/Fe3+-siderophores transport system ATPase subunit